MLTVMPNVSAYGMSNKESRGIVAGAGELPRSLRDVQATLGRFASRNGLDLNKPVAEIAAQTRIALAKPTPDVARRASKDDSDLSM